MKKMELLQQKLYSDFAKNNVVNLDKELEKDDEYVWANVKTVGKSASEVMREELPKVRIHQVY